MRRLLPLAVALLLATPAELLAYADKTTHARLTDGSFRLVPTEATEIHAFRCEVAHGSVSEDEEPRYLFHFWNPVTGRGLPRNSYTMAFSAVMGIATTGRPGPGLEPSSSYRTAMDWGWNEMEDDYDWLGAIEAYGDGDLQKAYTGLGHVLHLLQDLGQPDHSDSRPHPGNYVANYIPGITRVGYEGLWGQPNMFWPPGGAIERKPTLQGYFRAMADLARAEEAPVRARWRDEMALGLGTVKHDNVSRAVVALGEAAGFVDNNWKKFELQAAIKPLIPLQQNDRRFQDHLALGHRLLPRIEQFGAGLLLHFHEIVNPPPFIEGVEISQNGERKYLKGWSGGRGSTRSWGGTAELPLERDVPATVTIRVGPRHPMPAYGAPPEQGGSTTCISADPREQVRERLQTITVTIRTASGARTLPVNEGSEPGSPMGGVWTGTFTPTEGATLEIEATDADSHLAQRSPLGDVLDSNPATRARASTRDQFPWDGYEPGPDVNHSFRVAAPAGCDFDAESHRFGTWTGTYRLESASKGFDLQIGGKIWFDVAVSETATVRFRSLLRPAGECHELTRMEFGPGSGSYTRTKLEKVLERRVNIRPGEADRVTTTDTPTETTTNSGGAATANGRIDFEAGTYSAGMSSESSGREHGAGFHDSGRFEGCAIPTLSGGESMESGSPDDEFWSKREWSYTYTYSGPARPEHATLCPVCFEYGGTQMAIQSFVQRANNLLQQASSELYQSMRIEEGTAVANMMAEFDEFWTAYDYELETNVATQCDRASSLWLQEDPEYGTAVQDVEAASRAAEAQARDLATRAMQLTQRAAAALDRSSPRAAAALRTLSQILGTRGWTAFGG